MVIRGGGGGGGGGDNPANTNLVSLTDAKRLLNAAINRVYDGVDLTVRYADEIDSLHHGNPWAWIKSRIDNNTHHSGIYVGDWIPLSVAGHTFHMEIAGIDTYKGYGGFVDSTNGTVGNHIDFISREVWPDPIQWNLANYNNGLAAMPTPFLVSHVFAFLNSLQMDVPNAATADPVTISVDYRNTGIYHRLPEELRAVIAMKTEMMPRRYVAGVLLTEDNNWDSRSNGPLWLPSEKEVCGANVWGSRSIASPGFTTGGYVQYPIFATNMKRAKRIAGAATRANWWLSVGVGGGSNSVGLASAYGVVTRQIATAFWHVPICFRIA